MKETLFKLAMVVAPKEAMFEAVVREPLEKSLKLLHEIGFNGVELSVIDPGNIEVNYLRKILSEYGLEIPALSTGLNYIHHGLSLSSPNLEIRKRAVKRLKKIVNLAEKMEAGVVVGLMRGKSEQGIAKENAYKYMVEGLKEICSHAEVKGVKIFFEPLNRYETDLINTVDEGLKLLEEVGKDNLLLLLDTFHMNIEEANIEASIARAKNRIGHFHVADSNRLAPGMGHLNFKPILRSLFKSGYRGYLSAEIITKPSFEEAARTTYVVLKSAMGV